MLNIRKFLRAIGLVPKASAEIDSLGEFEVLSSTNKAHFHNGTSSSPVVTEAHSATLTNKSIDADTNTITNIENADIKSGAAIDAAKIANGSVSSIEFQYLDGVTSDIQTQLNGKQSSALTDAHILVGNGSNLATDVAVSGDVSISNTGNIQIVAGAIVDADINASAAIDASKIANGSVSSVEFQYLDGVTSAIQTQLNAKQTTTLTDGNILVGNGSNVATSVNPSGDIDISNTGVFSINPDVIVNAYISSTAAISYTKLNLTDAIKNSDVSSVAAIARTKLASGTASHVIVNDGSGVMSSVSKLPETQGGTNQSAYTTGDLLYASGSNTLSKLAIGSTSQVLTVTAGVPAWAAAGGGGSGSGLAGSGVTSTKSADYTVVSGDNGYLIPVDTSTAVVISLPQISSVATGFNVVIKDTTGSAATNNITINPYVGDFVDGADGIDFITGAYQAYAYVSNGTEWKKLAFTTATATGIRGVFLSGRTGSGTQTTNIEYINSSTLGNGTSFGSMGVSTRDRCSNGTMNNLTRGVVAGGGNAGGTNLSSMEYITIQTAGNAVSFGTLTSGIGLCSSLSNSTRGIIGPFITSLSELSYITIATTGNNTSFGTVGTSRDNQAAGVASSTRGVIGGGYNGGGPTAVMEYITIATTGNGTSFGNLATARQYHGGFGNLVRGIYVGGLDSGSSSIDNMEYITIATTGNGTSFGSIYSARNGVVGFSSSTRGIVAGGIGAANAVVNNIGYVTMATTGNTTSFGTLGTSRGGQGVACNFAKV